MAILDIFSKRSTRGKTKPRDVFTYDVVPPELRVQVVHLLRDVLGDDDHYNDDGRNAYRWIHDGLAREYGTFRLADGRDEFEALIQFFLSTEESEKALDIIEQAFFYINRIIRQRGRGFGDSRTTADEVIDELNCRFLEHGIGYRFEPQAEKLLRLDSEFLHAEVVKPALGLLHGGSYAGANAEFLKAHDHYRHRRYEEVLVDCLKALESTMKVICDNRGWAYDDKKGASELLNVCFGNGLVPSYLQSEFTALRTTLESGAPTVRNKTGGHGSGRKPRTIPAYLAAYALHLTASCIVFLVSADSNIP
jgi:hypothetical protein